MRLPVAVVSFSILLVACGNVPLDESPGDVLQGANDDGATEPRLGSNSTRSGPSLGNYQVRPGTFVIPGQVPVLGRSITSWTTSWYRWHFAVPADKSPILNLDQECGTEQDDHVFFVPTYDGAAIFERTCRVPSGKLVLVPVWAVVNDFPCPDPAFRPAPGQSMEDFLRQGAVSYDAGVKSLAVIVDDVPVALGNHRHTSRLFHFIGDPSLLGKIPDPCLTGGTSQPAVVDGWWLMLILAPGEHVVQVTGNSPEDTPFETKYRLNVDSR